jgi:hypothetical protein
MGAKDEFEGAIQERVKAEKEAKNEVKDGISEM